MEEKIVYFEKPGKENTEEVIRLALQRADSRGIKKIVVASTRGETAQAFSTALEGRGIGLVVVPWQYGFRDKGNPFPEDVTKSLREKGHRVHFGTMLFHTTEFYGTDAPKAMANLLRTFGQGVKVCVEILLMACDGGCVEAGEMVIAAAGTGSGSDTAVVATAASSTRLSSMRVHEIICKPIL